MAESYDAVLIGAGHNALACALHLAAKGWRVGLFEQATVAGGAVKTGEYTLPGFRHDWAAMNLSLFAGSAFFKAYGAELSAKGAEFVPVTQPFASAFPDRSWCGVSTDLAATRASIAALSEADAATWEVMQGEFPAKAEQIFGLLGSPMKIRALASFAFKMLSRQGLTGMLDLTRFLMLSPREFLTQTFESPKVQAMLGAWGMHLDFAPDVAGGGVFPYLEGMAGQAFGMALGKGGADVIIRALVVAIVARGGAVETGVSVGRILHDGRRATGVELADGRRITATKAVIAGVAPRELVRMTGPTQPSFDRAMAQFAHAPGT
ncbi:MAG: NAD(P)/FAD-dependent oxidoreductase, partial [Paracoccaceae bacterium]